MMKVRQVMRHRPLVIPPDANLIEAAEVMKREKVGTLIVARGDPANLRSGDLLGIVTDRDIVVRAIAESHDPEVTTVSQAMSTPVYYCMENEDLDHAVAEMDRKRVRRLAVMASETGQLDGVLSLDDVAEKARETLAQEALRVAKRSA